VCGFIQYALLCICTSYEGTGRSLSLKLMRELEKTCNSGGSSASDNVADVKKLVKGSQKAVPTTLASGMLHDSLLHMLSLTY
jgi:tRNA(Met) C34 N-acetyltransferase TmcA